MDNLNRYLIALDGSKSSMSAVEYAGKILPKESSEIVIFLVGADIPESFKNIEKNPQEKLTQKAVEKWIEKQNDLFSKTLLKAQEKLINLGFSKNRIITKTHPRETGITRDIAAEAAKGYTAVFAGRKGLADIKNLPLGSVARKLLARLTFTTLVLVGNNPETENILIGFDGSEGSKVSVKFAGQMFMGTSKKLHIRHVSKTVSLLEGDYDLFYTGLDTSNPVDKQRVENRVKKLEPELKKAIEKLKSLGFNTGNADTGIIEPYLSRALGLVEAAEKNNWGTIMLGRKGISRVQDFFIGRVSEKVADMAANKAVWIVSS